MNPDFWNYEPVLSRQWLQGRRRISLPCATQIQDGTPWLTTNALMLLPKSSQGPSKSLSAWCQNELKCVQTTNINFSFDFDRFEERCLLFLEAKHNFVFDINRSHKYHRAEIEQKQVDMQTLTNKLCIFETLKVRESHGAKTKLSHTYKKQSRNQAASEIDFG